MTNTGETPASDGEKRTIEDVHEVSFGETVYDEDGNKVGHVRGFDFAGFFVTTRDGAEAMSVEHARSGKDFGEAHLMWRCMECGEMGAIHDGIPNSCPDCGVEREALMYWTED